MIAKIYMGADHELERPGDQEAEPEGDAARPRRSRRSTARATRARPTTSPTTCRRSARSWKSKLGTGQSVNWPTGVGASGSAGVAGVVANTPGAICYIDTAFAVANHLHFAAIQNAAGKFIYPSIRNVAAAGGAVTTVPANNELHIVNPPKSLPTAYPIATYTYIILPTKSSKATELRKMVFWALTQGQSGEVHGEALVRADPEGRARRVREDAQAGSAVHLDRHRLPVRGDRAEGRRRAPFRFTDPYDPRSMSDDVARADRGLRRRRGTGRTSTRSAPSTPTTSCSRTTRRASGPRAPRRCARTSAGIFERWPSLRFRGRRFYAADDFAVSEWTATATRADGDEDRVGRRGRVPAPRREDRAQGRLLVVTRPARRWREDAADA